MYSIYSWEKPAIIVVWLDVRGRYQFLLPVREVVDCETHHLLRDIKPMMLVVFDMDGILHLALGRRGHDLGMEVLGQLCDRRHDALHIDHHGLDHAGHDAQFLLQESACGCDAVPDQDLVRGAAHADQVHALGALGFCIGDRSPDPRSRPRASPRMTAHARAPRD